MSDYVVTVPKRLWEYWLEEGDLPGSASSGDEYGFYCGGHPPRDGDRLYIVAHGKLRGYAPITRIALTERGFSFCRAGGAVACTISEPILGFRGYRRRWWKREDETDFPDWMVP